MKVVVFGGSGQVATELNRRAPSGVTIHMVGRDRADFADPGAVREAAQMVDADAFINAVAYTAVDLAEDEEDIATLINGTSVGVLAEVAADRALPLVHISTDYVFDGSGDRPWTPDDPANPLGAYGRSKRLGEIAIAGAGGKSAILRTSWVFSAHGGNFVKTMLRVGSERGSVRVVDDQFGGPTPASGIADACFGVAKALVEGADGGVHHFSGAPDVTWADFAVEIFSASGLKSNIDRISTSEYPLRAERPGNSRLNCSSLTNSYGIERPDWRAALQDVLKELGQYD